VGPAAPHVESAVVDGFAGRRLVAGDLDATFLPQLGMVGASLRCGGDELLDRQAGLRAYRDTGAVLGLPLLHPWANRLSADEYEVEGRRVELPPGSPRVSREEHGLAIHGLLAAHPGWTVEAEGSDAEAARLRARIDVTADPDVRAAFPFPHELTLDLALTARALTVATTLRPTGDAAVPVAFGFHPYLRLPVADRAAWEVELPERRHVRLDDRGIPAGGGDAEAAERFALGTRTFDDAYDGIADGAAFTVAGGGIAITVTHHEGFPVGQVYSPPGAQFICFEPMTAPVDALRSGEGLRRAEPGTAFTAVFSIAVRARTARRTPGTR
jgi:galactose mutarotase-like enzyme